MNENENLQPVQKLTPFTKMVMSIGTLPSSFYASMSYYESMVWLYEYLKNEVIPTVNNNGEAVEELQEAYVTLKNYIDTYFDNLDLQEEVNKKLDEMALDGSLTNLIKDYIDPLYQAYETEINNQIQTIDTKATNAINNANDARSTVNTFTSTYQGLLNQESATRQETDASLQTQISTIVASAGTAGDSSSEIVAARTNVKNITFTALNDRINYIENTIPFKYTDVENADLNNLLTPGTYRVYGTMTHAPTLRGSSFNTTTAYIIVEGINPVRNNSTGEITHYLGIIQKYYPFYGNPLNYRGYGFRLINWSNGSDSYVIGAWTMNSTDFIESIFQWNNKIKRYSLEDMYASNGSIGTATNLNTLTSQGNYILTNDNNTNAPTGESSGLLNVESNLLSNGNNFITQTFSTLNGSAIYARNMIIRDENPIYYDWYKISPNASTVQLSGKKIANFGDSIFGITQGANSVSASIAYITSATTYNLGFGGCQMSDRSDQYWKAFSMCNLAYAIANNDFTLQDQAINAEDWSDKPYYFDNTYSTLRSLDFSEIDYATIAYGTNDYTAGDQLDNPNNPKDINTFGGALRYSIEALQTAFPNLRIILGSPCLRLFNESGNIITSDTKTYGGGFTLIDMTEKVKEIALEYHLPFVDAYNNLGINKFNYTAFFDGTDLTHPNNYGNNLLGRLYAMKILGSE